MDNNITISKYSSWKEITILLADDDYSSFILVEEILSLTNAKLLYVDNGLDAVNICKTNNVDLILMDLKMPKMSGFQATKQIKELHPNIPIILVTACALASDIDSYKQCGCDDFFSKPVEIDKLVNKIASLLCQKNINWY